MIRWINQNLGTAPGSDHSFGEDVSVLDVRDLVDKPGNTEALVRQKIEFGASLLSDGKKLVVCCDYGISRSNAIAAGVLSVQRGITLNNAIRQVVEITGELDIKLGPLRTVRAALDDNEADLKRNGGKSVVLTGSTGFVGKSFTNRIGTDYELVSPSRADIDLGKGAVMFDLLVKENRPDCIVHLANPRVFTSNRAMGDMLTMLRNVIEVCCENDIRLIFPSSWEVYSAYQSGAMIVKQDQLKFARGSYGEAKLLCERLIDIHREQSGLKCALIRSATLYGETVSRPRFISTFVNKARKNEEIFTHKYLNGFPGLDLLHIDDYLSLIMAVLDKDFTGDLNLGSGNSVNTREIAEWIVAELGSTSEIKSSPVQSHSSNVVMDNARAKQLFAWEPKINWKAGISRLLGRVPE